jgi:DNA-binding GntR family transcriptional regulator
MGGGETRAELVFNQLRSDTLTGRWHPGQRLPFDELCKTYDASVGVMREALQRLAEQGLALVEPNRGFRVVPASVEDLRQLTEARVEIESMTLRKAVEKGGLEWESQVIAAHHLLERTPMEGENERHGYSSDWVELHRAFHETLLLGCDNERLRSIAISLRDAFEIYRHWSLKVGEGHERDVAAEHRRLLESVLDHDPDRAEKALRAHIELTKSLWTEAMEKEEETAAEAAVAATATPGRRRRKS